jgi:hypothetical protein
MTLPVFEMLHLKLRMTLHFQKLLQMLLLILKMPPSIENAPGFLRKINIFSEVLRMPLLELKMLPTIFKNAYFEFLRMTRIENDSSQILEN